MDKGRIRIGHVDFSFTVLEASLTRATMSMPGPEEIVVRVPNGVRVDIGELLAQHQQWVMRRHRELTILNPLRPVLTLDGFVWVLGQKQEVAGILAAPAQSVPECLATWFKEKSAPFFSQRLEVWGGHLGISYTAMMLSNARTRWGYCRPDGGIGLSWRLYQAPLWVIDYVIVHELVHRNLPHHQPTFWKSVRTAYPQSNDARKWLGTMGPALIW